MEILTGEQMRRVDRRVIEELGTAGVLLMESAGRGIADALEEDYPDLDRRGLLVLAGKGNNGGDGLVVARHLARRGVACRVILLANGDDLSGDAATNLAAARASGIRVDECPSGDEWRGHRRLLDRYGLVLDAMLGTGIKGGARGLAATVIQELNASTTPVAAVDLPSGLDGDSTEVAGVAVRAERTYTLCRPKLPILLGPGAALAGHWTVVPIGVPDAAVEQEDSRLEWLDGAVAAGLLPGREPDSHKGTYGHLLGVAGARGKAGAAVLLGSAALRSGAGLVTVAIPASTLPTVAAHRAELMTESLPETKNGAISQAAATPVLRLLEGCQALAIGPGLGTSRETADAVKAILRHRSCPAVVDADALNILSKLKRLGPGTTRANEYPLVLTPHPGEASRLLGRETATVQSDRLDAARTLASRTGAVVVLKGHRTLVATADGRVAVNASGNPGMATAGSGDVLTGMIGALLARGLPAWDAARLGVWLHGSAGDRAAGTRGEDGMIAGDLLSEIPGAMLSLASQETAFEW
jgi:NAD(P)H-hydrate epimerase